MLLFNAAFIEGASVFDDLQCEIGKQSAAFGERRTARVKNQTKRGGGATRRLSRSIGAASLKLRPLSRGQRDDPDNLCVRLSRRRIQFNPTGEIIWRQKMTQPEPDPCIPEPTPWR
jgi:hypothetical protein